MNAQLINMPINKKAGSSLMAGSTAKIELIEFFVVLNQCAPLCSLHTNGTNMRQILWSSNCILNAPFTAHRQFENKFFEKLVAIKGSGRAAMRHDL